jgi:GT2 family glycosyltransferase
MSGRFEAADVAVVIPTRDRWPILARTLEGLAGQTVQGFETLVVVDGNDQTVPHLDGAKFITKEHGGPGAARNEGARTTTKPIVLFLGDDMVPSPDLVARHLQLHQANPDDEVAILGHVDWHTDVARGRLERWMEWSRTQFDYPVTAEDEAGFGRFYSCNISLKRDFFLDSGGFDEAFIYYYEDLDCGWRLGQKGMRLLYEPTARTYHLHRYDLPAVKRRFEGLAAGEFMMAAKHPWFDPYFLRRVRGALELEVPNHLWPLLVDRIPPQARGLRERSEARASTWYHQAVAPSFLGGWAAASDLAELQEYLGERFDHEHLRGHQQAVDDERAAAGDEETFYRTSNEYLYDLTVFAMSGTKAPYLADLRAIVPRGGRLLDYGCGIGADGLRLAADGYDVSFADFANPSTTFLRWRLQRRGLRALLYDLDNDEIPGGFDAAYSFDVIEHVEDPFAFLRNLERKASVVAVNFLEEDEDDTDLHRPLPIGKLLDHAAISGLIRYRRYHDRSHLVIYRSSEGPRVSRLHSAAQRRLGSRLAGSRPWFPVPQGHETRGV